MLKLSEIPLSEKGRLYLSDNLCNESGLCTCLAELDLHKGHLFAVLPEGTTSFRAEKFELGGVSSQGGRDVWLAKRIQKLGAEFSSGIFVVQDVWAQPKDAEPSQTGPKYFCSAGSVYYFCVPPFSEIDTIRSLREVLSFKFVAAFCAPICPPESKIMDVSYVGQLVQTSIEIYLDAYDQEGLIVWRREASPRDPQREGS